MTLYGTSGAVCPILEMGDSECSLMGLFRQPQYPDDAMARAKLTTTQRGYGADHQRERELRLQRYRPGDRCAHGRERMWWWPLELARKQLHRPHNADRTGYLQGL